MAEISNKTIAILLTLAIVVSCVGIILKNTQYGGVEDISGAGTIGEVNVTITSQIAINVTFPSINFGSGYVSPGQAYACLNSENGVATGWSATTTRNSSIILENIGNTDLNVTFNMDKSAASFIGGIAPNFTIKVTNNDTNSCDPVGTKGGFGVFAVYAAVVAANENKSVCNNLTARDGADSININTNITIPADSLGTKGVMLLFEASIPK